MAVTAESTPQSTPDLGKLQGMASPVVMVVKGRKGASRSIISGVKGMNVDDILALQDRLPQQHGPGIYSFEVFDEAGDGKEKCKWTVQLGADNAQQQSNSPFGDMSVPPTNGVSMPMPQPNNRAGGATLPEGIRMIGPGLWYDESLGLLTNRHGEAFQWKPGMPLPGAFGQQQQAQAPANQTTSFPATPWAPPGTPPFAFPGWGGYPAYGGTSSTEDDLKRQLAEEREARKEAERRREIDQLRETVADMQKAADARFEKLLSTLQTAKADGPSERERALEAQIAETRRALEAQSRDAEARRREDQLREEIRSNNERMEKLVREMSANKQDPMIPMLTQLLTTQQQSTTAMLASMEKASASTGESMREYIRSFADRFSTSMMTPEKTLELIKLAKDQGPNAEAQKGLADMYRTVFGMAQDLIRLQSDIGNAGAESPLMGMAREALGRIGTVAQSYAQSKAREEAKQEAETARAEHERRARMAEIAQQQHQRQMQQPTTLPARASAPVVPAVAPIRAPAPAATVPQSAAAIREAAAAKIFPQSTGSVADRDALAAQVFAPAQSQPSAPMPPPAPVATSATTMVEDIRVVPVNELTADQIRPVIANMPDAAFFGPAYDHVVNLREAVGTTGALPVDQTASFVLQALQMLADSNEFPPAFELLRNGHVNLVIERLLPDVVPAYRTQLVAQLQAIADEAGDGDEADEND